MNGYLFVYSFSIVVLTMENNNQNIIMGSKLMVKLNLTNFLEWEDKLIEIVRLNGFEYNCSIPCQATMPET